MLAEIRDKSQVTIPKKIVNMFSLSKGDKVDIFEKDGIICLMPVAVYPKSYVDGLKSEIQAVKENLKAGKQPVFDNVDALFEKLENK
ncbi:MAG: AbrB/MazE/SpoVT family DNA-binding domain-containing protein [Sphaerochaetaceae bacterium]